MATADNFRVVQYDREDYRDPGRGLEKFLNDQAAQGWECLTVNHAGHMLPMLAIAFFQKQDAAAAIEYKIVQHCGKPMGHGMPCGGFEKLLGELAGDGWTCFAVSHGGNWCPDLTKFYLKRPKDNPRNQTAAA